MADQKSTQFDNITKEPVVKVKPAELYGRVRYAVAELNGSELDSNLSDGDVLKLTKLPRNAVLTNVRVYSDGVAGMTDEDLGDSNDADAIMDGIDVSSAAQIFLTDNSNGTNGVDYVTDAAKELWNVLGYSDAKSAPREIEVLLTTSGATGSGNLSFVFEYVVD